MEVPLATVICFIVGISAVLAAGGGISSSNQESGFGEDTESTKLLREGGKLVLNCPKVQSLPIVWKKNGESIRESERIIMTEWTLEINKATKEDLGDYVCYSVTEIDSYTIQVIYLSYKRMPKSVTVFEGDHFSLKCEVEAQPAPNLSWFKGGMPLEDVANDSQYQMKQNEQNVENAVVYFSNAQQEDRGEYTCAIESHGIHVNSTSYVRVKDKYAALWPFLGICVEVLVLCAVIFLYEKNRTKRGGDESDTDPSDQKNSGSEEGSVRQRK